MIKCASSIDEMDSIEEKQQIGENSDEKENNCQTSVFFLVILILALIIILFFTGSAPQEKIVKKVTESCWEQFKR